MRKMQLEASGGIECLCQSGDMSDPLVVRRESSEAKEERVTGGSAIGITD